jgi:hypothetical protein
MSREELLFFAVAGLVVAIWSNWTKDKSAPSPPTYPPIIIHNYNVTGHPLTSESQCGEPQLPPPNLRT